MKYFKLLGLAAVTAAALMASVGTGTASAATLTCTNPPGTKVVCPKPLNIEMRRELNRYILHLAAGKIECEEYSEKASITETGSSTTTASGSITSMAFSGCNATVTVLSTGSMEIHYAEGVNGSVTTTGTETTTEFAGLHCIFTTNNTNIGKLTGSSTTKGNPTFDTTGSKLPRTGGRSGAFCGSTAEVTETDAILTPDWLDVDP